MLQINAKEFSSRSDLEQYVENVAGRTNEKNTGYEITGTREELVRLGLSDKRTVFGVVCVITDTPTQRVSQQKKPDRGEVHPFGINGNLTKRKK